MGSCHAIYFGPTKSSTDFQTDATVSKTYHPQFIQRRWTHFLASGLEGLKGFWQKFFMPWPSETKPPSYTNYPGPHDPHQKQTGLIAGLPY